MTMTPAWIMLAMGLVVGIAAGATVAAICLMDKPQWWTVCLRLPEPRRRQLSREARKNMRDLKAEIINRLEASL
jgi:Arc-like DNA binding domain